MTTEKLAPARRLTDDEVRKVAQTLYSNLDGTGIDEYGISFNDEIIELDEDFSVELEGTASLWLSDPKNAGRRYADTGDDMCDCELEVEIDAARLWDEDGPTAISAEDVARINKLL